VHAARLTAQQLSGPPAHSPEEVVRRLLAVQAQDPRGARLAVRGRSVGLRAADVDEALTATRSLVVSWLNRGTLHLVTPDDYRLLHPLTTPQLVTGNVRRLRQEGVSEAQADRGVQTVVDAVGEGPQTRAALRPRLDAAGVPTKGQALVHVLMAATLRGEVVRGPVVGGDQAYVGVRAWLGAAPDPLDREEALARLARRYLAGHGPADHRDLARWAGITVGDARRGLDDIAGDLVRLDDGAVDLADREPPAPLPAPRLLGAFDPLLLGWVSREAVVGPHQGLVTTNGLFRPFALVAGRAVATWGLADGTVTIRLLEAVETGVAQALRDDARDVLRYLGLPAHEASVGVSSH
jgi:hypothetical protein